MTQQSRAGWIVALIICVLSVATAQSRTVDGKQRLPKLPGRRLFQVKTVSSPDMAQTGTWIKLIIETAFSTSSILPHESG